MRALVIGLVTVTTVACSSSCGAPKDAPVTTPATIPSATASSSPMSSSPPVTAASASATTATAAPITQLTSRRRPMPRPACPLTLEPGVGFGPVDVGETKEELLKLGAKPFGGPSTGDTEFFELAGLKVSLCGGKVIDIWLDDLRKAPDCVTYQDTPVARTITREALEKRLGGCVDTAPRTGGTFEKCAAGGAYVGHGMGDFMQLRVRPRGDAFDMDGSCARALDDGSPISLDAKTRAKILEQLVILDVLSPYWHPSTAGRKPLRIVKNAAFAENPSFMMFGEDVTWIERTEAKPGTAYFDITSFVASKTKVHVEFAYPVEGVRGSADLVPDGMGHYRVEKREAHESK